MDINSPEFAKEFDSIVRAIARDEFKKLVSSSLRGEVVGKVAAGGSGATINVYINSSGTAVAAKNPRGLTLAAGQLVAVRYPNFRDDRTRFIDRAL